MRNRKDLHTLRTRALAATLATALALCWEPVQAQDRLRPPGLGYTRDFEHVYPSGYVMSLGVFDDGNGKQLYAGGDLDQVTGQLQFMSIGIVRWDGAVWSRVSWGVEHDPIIGVNEWLSVLSMQEFDDGGGSRLYLGGTFNRYWSSTDHAYIPTAGIVTWDGHSLVPLAQPGPFVSVGYARDMVVYDDGSGSALYIAGKNNGAMYKYSSAGLQSVGGYLTPSIAITPICTDIVVHDDGSGSKLYVAGNFERVYDTGSTTTYAPATGLAVWDGVRWTPILGPWTVVLSARLEGRMVSYDDGGGAGLYMSVPPFGVLCYRNGLWEQILPFGPPSPSSLLGVYDDGNGPALYVTGTQLPIPGIDPSERVQLAKYDHGVWHALGRSTTEAGTTIPANCAVVCDLGEGPDLYLGTNQGGTTAGGQDPVSMVRYRGVHRDVAPVCGGDGSLSPCPCTPRGIVGRGCPNSADRQGAALTATGKPVDDTLRLSVAALPATASTLLLQGDAYDFTPSFAGHGVLCTSGTIRRLAWQVASAGETTFAGPGAASLRALATLQGDLLPPGSVRYYQVWYRDTGARLCSGTVGVNVTNGMRVVW